MGDALSVSFIVPCFTVLTKNKTKHEKFDIGCQLQSNNLYLGLRKKVIIPGKYCRAGAPVKSCYQGG